MAQEKFAVIGAGHFGQAISLALSEKGHEVLVIDNDINVIQEISEDVAYAVCVDATNKRALLNENILNFDAVIVSIGNDFVGRLLCTANLLDVGVKRIICRVMGKSQRTILEKMGIKSGVLRAVEGQSCSYIISFGFLKWISTFRKMQL